MPARCGSEENIHICHAEIGIDDKNAVPPLLKGDRKVDGKVGLANAPLAARDRNHAHVRPRLCLCERGGHCRLRTDHLAQPRCLIRHIIPSRAIPRADPPSPV